MFSVTLLSFKGDNSCNSDLSKNINLGIYLQCCFGEIII